MQLRIFRRFTWELDCPSSEVRFGGSNPMKLVAHDELQYAENYGSVNVIWKPVTVVEDEKPESPMSYRDRKFAEQAKKQMEGFDTLLQKAKKLERII
jgi:hypothetical protein